MTIIPFDRVEPARPVMRSGKRFCDLSLVDPALRPALMDRKIVFLTEFAVGADIYGGSIIAACWEDAEDIADLRGLGEKVIGTLAGVISA